MQGVLKFKRKFWRQRVNTSHSLVLKGQLLSHYLLQLDETDT